MQQASKERAIEIDRILTNDLRIYAEYAPLKVKHKEPTKGVVPFKLNNAQNIVHEKLEAQLKATGKVRAIILKGRQQGVSTYIGARFYHKTSRRPANNTFIMTHLAEATSNLYSMTCRYHDNVDLRLQTPTKSLSATGLEFEGLDSNYRVSTAGSKQSGRSYTVTNFHLSEYAFYPDPDSIKTGALQTVPESDGTEVIIESTANGMNNDFYKMSMDAINGKGEFILVFVPWFVQEEYRKTSPKDIVWTQKELEIKERYGLEYSQLYWRRNKIDTSFSGKETKFMQEYPCNPYEAFQASDDTLIDIEKLMDARKRTVADYDSPMILGVDPAHRGDRAVISARQGRKLKSCLVYDTKEEPLEPMEFVAIIIQAIKEFRPVKVFVDKGENGHAICSRLWELGYRDRVVAVDFGMRAFKRDVYENKRAEMWVSMRDWLENDEPQIPDDDEIQADLMAMPDYLLTTSNKIKLISKQKLKEDFKMSPDIGDSIALTFAFPVDPLNKGEVKSVGGIVKRRGHNQVKLKGSKKTIKM